MMLKSLVTLPSLARSIIFLLLGLAHIERRDDSIHYSHTLVSCSESLYPSADYSTVSPLGVDWAFPC